MIDGKTPFAVRLLVIRNIIDMEEHRNRGNFIPPKTIKLINRQVFYYMYRGEALMLYKTLNRLKWERRIKCEKPSGQNSWKTGQIAGSRK